MDDKKIKKNRDDAVTPYLLVSSLFNRVILFICAKNVDKSRRAMRLLMDVLRQALELYELCLVRCWCSTDNLGVGWPRTKTRILNLKKKVKISSFYVEKKHKKKKKSIFNYYIIFNRASATTVINGLFSTVQNTTTQFELWLFLPPRPPNIKTE